MEDHTLTLHSHLAPYFPGVLIDLIENYNSFVYDHWGIITPYLLSKGEFDIDTLEDCPTLSISALSMYWLFEKSQYEIFDGDVFSDETLRNMVDIECCRDELMDEGMDDDEAVVKVNALMKDREWLLSKVYNRINGEFEGGNYHPRDYPIGNLLNGQFYNGNWEYLSDFDLRRIAYCYGHIPRDCSREYMVDFILTTQTLS